jgi:hypothetical protein
MDLNPSGNNKRPERFGQINYFTFEQEEKQLNYFVRSKPGGKLLYRNDCLEE